MHASRRIRLVLAAAALALCVFTGTALAAPSIVSVRVEGLHETVLAPVQVTTTTTPVIKDGNPEHSCSGASAAGALELATQGSWSGTWFKGLGYSVETIKGESFPFTGINYWSYWVDNKPATAGICEGELSAGDSILFYPECFSETPGECPPSPNPLGIEAPPVGEVGRPLSVTVTSYDHASGAPTPAVHARVAFAEGAAETDSSGHATLTFSHPGEIAVQVTAPESVRTETTICVHAGNDGNCGTTAATPGSPALTAGSPPPYTGAFALVADVSGLTDGHVYSHHGAPRLLSGTIRAHSAVTSVSLELRRRHRGRCYAYDGVSERFRRARCGSGSFFKVASGGTFSYLLPAALAPGRYVLDVQATDVSGNHLALARGTSRIVFYVR